VGQDDWVFIQFQCWPLFFDVQLPAVSINSGQNFNRDSSGSVEVEHIHLDQVWTSSSELAFSFQNRELFDEVEVNNTSDLIQADGLLHVAVKLQDFVNYSNFSSFPLYNISNWKK